MRSFVRVVLIGALLSGSAALLSQARPTVVHGQVSTEAAEQGLAAKLDQLKREPRPLWVGYSIPVEQSFHMGSNAKTAYLEGERDGWTGGGGYGQDRAFDHALVLLRLSGGGVDKVRVESPDRELNAGGLRFVWLTGVTPGDSIRTLRSLAVKGGVEKLRQEAVFAISLHEDAEATPALAGLAGSGQEPELREKAAFWLASGRGHDGFVAIQRLAREDADARFREKLTFDLTLSHDPAAIEELVRMAHSDSSPKVRRQAQFWMATVGGKKVAADLRASAEKDPDTEVRKAAVFALSRLPSEEAAAQLIQVAQTSSDAAVRKQAVFWLGQSSDPKALDYLTRLLQ